MLTSFRRQDPVSVVFVPSCLCLRRQGPYQDLGNQVVAGGSRAGPCMFLAKGGRSGHSGVVGKQFSGRESVAKRAEGGLERDLERDPESPEALETRTLRPLKSIESNQPAALTTTQKHTVLACFLFMFSASHPRTLKSQLLLSDSRFHCLSLFSLLLPPARPLSLICRHMSW